MRILVACEESQRVTYCFRHRGHEAFSCDLEKQSGGYPEWHIRRDVREVLQDKWDMVIAHPPCTHLSVSGAKWFKEKKDDGRQWQAIEFFMVFTRLRHVPRVCIENPVCIMSSLFRKPDQIINPWQFGHGETKSTCLWLKGMVTLKPTQIVAGRIPRIHYIGSNPNRSRERSKTFWGIALAMSQQWG